MLVFLIQVAWSGVLAVIMLFQWRGSIDEPDVSYACDDGGTCYGGPTSYLVLTLVFGGICLVFLTIVGVLVGRWRVAAVRRARLVATGVRVPALLARIEPTNTTVYGRNLVKLVFEARPGGRVVRVVERSMAVLPIGTRATIAHDSANPENATVVDDLNAMAAAAARQSEQRQQAVVDAMFNHQRQAGGALAAVRDAVAQNIEVALAELRAKLDRGDITRAEYEQQKDALMRVLEMPTDRPMS